MWLIRQIGNFAIAISELWLLGLLSAIITVGGICLSITLFAVGLTLTLIGETLVMDLTAATVTQSLNIPVAFDPVHPVSLLLPFAVGVLVAWWPTAAWYQFVRRNWIGKLRDRQRKGSDDRSLDVYVRMLRDREWEEWAVTDPQLRSLTLLRDGYRCRWCSALCNTVRYLGAPESSSASGYVPELPAPAASGPVSTSTALEASAFADPAMERAQTICHRCFNRLVKA